MDERISSDVCVLGLGLGRVQGVEPGGWWSWGKQGGRAPFSFSASHHSVGTRRSLLPLHPLVLSVSVGACARWPSAALSSSASRPRVGAHGGSEGLSSVHLARPRPRVSGSGGSGGSRQEEGVSRAGRSEQRRGQTLARPLPMDCSSLGADRGGRERGGRRRQERGVGRGREARST